MTAALRFTVALLGGVSILLASTANLGALEGVELQPLIDAAKPESELVLEAGDYLGPVTIDKSLTIRGVGWPTVDGGGSGSVFTVNSPDVTIEGLVIRHTGDSLDRENSGISSDMSPRIVVRNNRFEDVLFGVFLRTSPEAVVAENDIGAKELGPGRRGDGVRLWESPDSLVEGNTIVGGRDTVLWFTDRVVVRNNVVEDGRYGLHFMFSDGAVVEGNQLTGNSVGAFLMYSQDLILRDNLIVENYGPSGYGVGLKDMDGITATGNRLVGNRVGLYLDNSPSAAGVTQLFDGNVMAYNGVGVLFQPSVKNNTFVNNSFIDNREQVGIQGTGTFSGNTWTVDGSGNYWSDFAGYDADGDGLGDTSYLSQDLYSELTDDHPQLHFFDETPAARAVDLASRMFPVFEPRPKLEDTGPLMRSVKLTPIAGSQRDGIDVGGVIVAVVLLMGAGGLMAVGTRSRKLVAI